MSAGMPGSSLSPYTRTREQLDAVLRSREGNLDDTPVPVLLLALAVREERALLTLRPNQLQKEGVFDEGSPLDFPSNISTETLGPLLVAAGQGSEQGFHAALPAPASRARPPA